MNKKMIKNIFGRPFVQRGVLAFKLEKIKKLQDKQEHTVICKYRKVILKEPQKDGGHVDLYDKAKEKCEEIAKNVNATEDSFQSFRLMQEEFEKRQVAIERINDARLHLFTYAFEDLGLEDFTRSDITPILNEVNQKLLKKNNLPQFSH